MRSLNVLAVILVGTISGQAQQPNSTTASAVIAGVQGPPWPIVLMLPQGSTTIAISGTPAQPYLVVQADAGLGSMGLATSFGLLDLELAAGFHVVIDGISCPCAGLNISANTGVSGLQTWTVPFAYSPPHHFGAFQALVSDPTAPGGLTFSAATDVTTTAAQVAIHVSATLGAPGNPGSASAPLPTITAGIAAALAAGVPHPPVWAHAGTYVESPVFADGVSVHGGCDPSTWLPAPQAFSVVMVGTTPAVANGITTPTAITGLDLRAADATAGSAPSIALRVIACSDQLEFYGCRFMSGRGGDGAPGNPGVPGIAGANGEYGCWWSSALCGISWWMASLSGLGGAGVRPGGRGGDGGQLTSSFVWNGLPGEDAPFGGGAGGAGGISYW